MIEQFESSLVKWAVKNAGIGSGKVFFSYLNTIMPEPPYIMIDIISGPNNLGTGSLIFNENNNNFDYKSILQFSVQFTVYGNECLSIATELINSLSKQSVRNDFFQDNVTNTSAFNFGIINAGSIENVDYLKSSTVELSLNYEQTLNNFENKMNDFTVKPENQLENKMKSINYNL